MHELRLAEEVPCHFFWPLLVFFPASHFTNQPSFLTSTATLNFSPGQPCRLGETLEMFFRSGVCGRDMTIGANYCICGHLNNQKKVTEHNFQHPPSSSPLATRLLISIPPELLEMETFFFLSFFFFGLLTGGFIVCSLSRRIHHRSLSRHSRSFATSRQDMAHAIRQVTRCHLSDFFSLAMVDFHRAILTKSHVEHPSRLFCSPGRGHPMRFAVMSEVCPRHHHLHSQAWNLLVIMPV